MDQVKAEELERLKKQVDEMSHEEMCRLYRFAPSGSVWFDGSHPISDYFLNKYKRLGGMTPEISKKIGWL